MDKGIDPLRIKLDVARLPSSRCPRQPAPDKTQRSTPCVINAYCATRPAGKNLTVRSQAMIKKLKGVSACHTPHLMPHADAAALISPPNGITLDLVMKNGAGAG